MQSCEKRFLRRLENGLAFSACRPATEASAEAVSSSQGAIRQ